MNGRAITACLAAAIVAGGCGRARLDREAVARPPDVVVYLIDTLRADRVGAWGGAAGLTPHLDALAQEGWVFFGAVAQSSFTRPSVASLFTGLGPLEHGTTTLESVLPPEAVTMAERLRERGYRTAGFSTNLQVRRETGLDQGFDAFAYVPRDHQSGRLAPKVRRTIEQLAADPAPFFLYVHALDPHAPYEPPEPWRSRFAAAVVRPEAGSLRDVRRVLARPASEREPFLGDLRALYDAEAASADAGLGAVVEALRAAGRWDGALVMALSDHGEEFNEHGQMLHARNLHRETIDVPWIVKWPAGSGGGAGRGRSTRLVEHLDALPTVLEAVGAPPEPGLAGRSLRSSAGLDLDARGETAPSDEDRAVLSHLDHKDARGLALTTARWRLIEPLSPLLGDRPRLYDRLADPGETTDLAAARPEVLDGLRRRLAAIVRAQRERGLAPLRATLDEESRRQFEALGYLGN